MANVIGGELHMVVALFLSNYRCLYDPKIEQKVSILYALQFTAVALPYIILCMCTMIRLDPTSIELVWRLNK